MLTKRTAAKVQKAMAPSAEPAPAAAEAQRQVQATEALRPDLREAELKLKIESLAEKCAGLEALVAELKDSNAHLVRLNAHALERNKELCRLLLAKEG